MAPVELIVTVGVEVDGSVGEKEAVEGEEGEKQEEADEMHLSRDVNSQWLD